MGSETEMRVRERELFLDALDIADPAERAVFLDRACAGNPGLRTSVEALLGNHLEDDFLKATDGVERLVDAAKGRAEAEAAEFPAEGTVIGRFRLVSKLGEGGCGAVFLAEQQAPVKRRVALKLIKLGMDSPGVIARFEAEQQALAMMDHPNIARVLETGTTELGRPFFVMELVEGVRITEFCTQQGLGLEARLKLFMQVCDAVQHAHQKGIIHRDLKPSNVLVIQQGDKPTPKVIDFGIAKAVGQRLTDKTVHTGFHFFVGTPAYTSPEQAEMGALDIDTRSDIYSLGVVLYELLAGEPPFDPERLSKSGFDEMRRIIRETEPEKPSLRIKRLARAEAECKADGFLNQNPRHLVTEEVSSDLDWIVMKCLEKDRSRRYPTARDLALELERYLYNEPISARPPSAKYRIHKFIRRNRAMVAAIAVVSVTLVASTVVSLRQAYRATSAEQEQNQLRVAAESAQLREFEQLQQARQDRLEALRQAYNSDMNLVQQALAVHNFGRASFLLERHRPVAGETDFRQWEWRYYWNQVRSSAVFDLPSQGSRVSLLSISDDGNLLVSADDAGNLKVWDPIQRKPVGSLSDRNGRTESAMFSRDRHLLVTLSRDASIHSLIRVWSLGSNRMVAQLPVPPGALLLGFDDSGGSVRWMGSDGSSREWGFARGPAVSPDSSRPGRPRGEFTLQKVISRDGMWSATAGEQGSIQLVSMANPGRRTTVTPFSTMPASMALSPDGKALAVTPSYMVEETGVKVYAMETGALIHEFKGNGSWVPSVAFAPDGNLLATGGADQILRVWDLRTGTEVAALRGHMTEIHSVCWLADGVTLASGSKDGAILFWDTRRSEPRSEFIALPGKTRQVGFLRDMDGFLTVSDDGLVHWWNHDLIEQPQVTALKGGVVALQVDPVQGRVYAARESRDIVVVDWPSGGVVTNLAILGSRRSRWDLQLRGNHLIALNPEGSIQVWDVRSWQVRAQWESPRKSWTSYALSADGLMLALPGSGEDIEILNVMNGQLAGSVPSATGSVGPMAYAPNGRYFARASTLGNLALWDAASMQMLDELRGHLLGIHGIAFSPDSQRLASMSSGREAIKLWDVETRHEVATLAGSGGIFTRMGFSPEGTFLVAINSKDTACVWRAPTFEQIEQEQSRGKGVPPTFFRP